MSKKSKSKAKSPRKPTLIEVIILLFMTLLIMLIAFAAIFNRTPPPIRLFFVAVETITIEDNWSGLSDIQPSFRYQLNFQNGALVGTADFSIGYDAYQELNVPIEIPVDVTQAFFAKLKESELAEGQYEPNIMWTDDYPSLNITIDTRREVIELYTQSQGEDHIPWGATIRGKEYIIDSGIPSEALAILEPYMKKDILDELIEGFRENEGYK